VWFSLERTTSVVAGESSEAGNPGTLGMTKERVVAEAALVRRKENRRSLISRRE
jgi:hypothetical protein